MKRILQLLSAALLLAATSFAADVPFTANLKNFTSSPASAYIVATLVGCGEGNIPVTSADVKVNSGVPLLPNSYGAISTTLTPNTDITCGAVTDGTLYQIAVKERKTGQLPNPQTDRTIAWGLYHVGATAFALTASASPSSPGPSGSSADLSAYMITRPFRRLNFAQFPASCTASKDWIERADADVAGQVLYRCNAAGSGWDLVGDGGSGGGTVNLAAPGPIGASTPSSGKFTDVTANSYCIGTSCINGWPSAGSAGKGWSYNLSSPSVGDSGLYQAKVSQAVTLTRVSCDTDSGTVTVNLDVRQEATPNIAGATVLTASLTCDNNGESSTAFMTSAVAANSPVSLLVTGVSGSPKVVRVHVASAAN